MKPELKISKKSKSRHPHHEAPSATPERRFRTMPIGPKERVMISKYFDHCLTVIQNHGPGKISVEDSHLDGVELKPGKLLVTAAGGHLVVVSKDKNAALIELEFIPTFK